MTRPSVHRVTDAEIDAALTRFDAVDVDASNMLRAAWRLVQATAPDRLPAVELVQDAKVAAELLERLIHRAPKREQAGIAELTARLRRGITRFWDI